VRRELAAACTRSEAQLIVDMALQGVPPDQILDAYEFSVEWNRRALIAALRRAEEVLERALREDSGGDTA
jgi:hypothetical protein